jgi:hypothetical protein
MQVRTRLSALLFSSLLALFAAGVVATGCRELHSQSRFSGGDSLSVKNHGERRREAASLPKGTKIHVRVKDAILMVSEPEGRRFEGTLDKELKLSGRRVVPENTKVVGRLTKVLKPASGKGLTEIGLVLEALVLKDAEVKLSTATLTFQVPPAAADQAGDSRVIYPPGTRLTFKLLKPLHLPAGPQTGWLPPAGPAAPRRATK